MGVVSPTLHAEDDADKIDVDAGAGGDAAAGDGDGAGDVKLMATDADGDAAAGDGNGNGEGDGDRVVPGIWVGVGGGAELAVEVGYILYSIYLSIYTCIFCHIIYCDESIYIHMYILCHIIYSYEIVYIHISIHTKHVFKNAVLSHCRRLRHR